MGTRRKPNQQLQQDYQEQDNQANPDYDQGNLGQVNNNNNNNNNGYGAQRSRNKGTRGARGSRGQGSGNQGYGGQSPGNQGYRNQGSGGARGLRGQGSGSQGYGNQGYGGQGYDNQGFADQPPFEQPEMEDQDLGQPNPGQGFDEQNLGHDSAQDPDQGFDDQQEQFDQQEPGLQDEELDEQPAREPINPEPQSLAYWMDQCDNKPKQCHSDIKDWFVEKETQLKLRKWSLPNELKVKVEETYNQSRSKDSHQQWFTAWQEYIDQGGEPQVLRMRQPETVIPHNRTYNESQSSETSIKPNHNHRQDVITWQGIYKGVRYNEYDVCAMIFGVTVIVMTILAVIYFMYRHCCRSSTAKKDQEDGDQDLDSDIASKVESQLSQSDSAIESGTNRKRKRKHRKR